MADVRSLLGIPITGDFASNNGTPLVVDQSSGRGYVMLDTNAIVPLNGRSWDVEDFGASPSASSATNRIAINTAIAQASPGDAVLFPRLYGIDAGIVCNKRLSFKGRYAYGGLSNDVTGSGIYGSGFALLTLQAACFVDQMIFFDPAGHASTIGIDLNNGANGLTKWTLRNSTILSYVASGYGTLGTGIRGKFALEGVVDNCIIEGYLNGIDWDEVSGGRSNANDIRGCKIRQNTIGLLVTSADNAMVSGSTIEGNSTGIKLLSGALTAAGNHFENNLGSRREIHANGGSVVSLGNRFYGGTSTDKDIYVEAGSQGHMSIGDTLNFGIKHNGTGPFTLYHPVIAPSVSGTGSIARIDFSGYTVLQGFASSDLTFQSGANLVLTPGSDIQVKRALIAMGGGAPATLGTIGGSGPSNAAQQKWKRELDENGDPYWTPIWT